MYYTVHLSLFAIPIRTRTGTFYGFIWNILRMLLLFYRSPIVVRAAKSYTGLYTKSIAANLQVYHLDITLYSYEFFRYEFTFALFSNDYTHSFLEEFVHLEAARERERKEQEKLAAQKEVESSQPPAAAAAPSDQVAPTSETAAHPLSEPSSDKSPSSCSQEILR